MDLKGFTGRDVSAFAVIDNLLNTAPPFFTPATGSVYAFSGSSGYYDLNGRRYRVGLRFAF